MAIIEMHGFPGAGKTTVLTMIAQKLLQGKKILGLSPTEKIYTSFPCPGCYQIDPDDLGKYNFCHATILIDEISLYFDNRQFSKFSSDALYFWKLHRHFHLNLVYCSQGANDADLKIRTLVDETYIIEPFFDFSILKPIQKYHSVVNGKPEQVFELAPAWFWLFVYRPKWYGYFNSYEVKPLPEPMHKLWSAPVPPAHPVRDVVQNVSRIVFQTFKKFKNFLLVKKNDKKFIK